MATQVQQPKAAVQSEDQYAKYLPIAGTVVGGIYGGPAGATAGGAVGGFAAQSMTPTPTEQPESISAPQSSPLARRQEAIASDPATQMRQGKIALNSMDEETRKAFEPVLDEGLRRAAQQRQQAYGYSNSTYTT